MNKTKVKLFIPSRPTVHTCLAALIWSYTVPTAAIMESAKDLTARIDSNGMLHVTEEGSDATWDDVDVMPPDKERLLASARRHKAPQEWYEESIEGL